MIVDLTSSAWCEYNTKTCKNHGTEHSLERLIKKSKGLNEVVLVSLRKTEWSDVDEKVWMETSDEMFKSWIGKPDVESFSFVVKRFGSV